MQCDWIIFENILKENGVLIISVMGALRSFV